MFTFLEKYFCQKTVKVLKLYTRTLFSYATGVAVALDTSGATSVRPTTCRQSSTSVQCLARSAGRQRPATACAAYSRSWWGW